MRESSAAESWAGLTHSIRECFKYIKTFKQVLHFSTVHVPYMNEIKIKLSILPFQIGQYRSDYRLGTSKYILFNIDVYSTDIYVYIYLYS